ncbi:MAG: DUF3467 domain-containing protein [Deltaproteobacteria bacterium]|nr:DUF3467 domain-containing protein [Deltaproteobacteria bacterium]MCL5278224.1 DUF3467 domain-containing protein [Deltaproteobacteria bacterium]
MQQNQEPKKDAGIQIQLDELTAQGVYINLALINHTETEFILDFIYVQPQAPQGKVRSRVLTSPIHMKRLLNAVTENIKKYEERFGEIRTAQEPQAQKIGFLQ